MFSPSEKPVDTTGVIPATRWLTSYMFGSVAKLDFGLPTYSNFEVGWVSDSKYKPFLHQDSTSFCNTTTL